MGINLSAKGYRMMNIAKAVAEEQGYEVVKIKRTKWGKEDFFGCADLIICNKFAIKLIGVTSKSNISRVRKRFENFNNHPACVKKEIWYYDKQGKWFIESRSPENDNIIRVKNLK